MDPEQLLQWQHQALEKVCGQMPKGVRDHMLTNLAKSIRQELAETMAK